MWAVGKELPPSSREYDLFLIFILDRRQPPPSFSKICAAMLSPNSVVVISRRTRRRHVAACPRKRGVRDHRRRFHQGCLLHIELRQRGEFRGGREWGNWATESLHRGEGEILWVPETHLGSGQGLSPREELILLFSGRVDDSDICLHARPKE